MRRPNRHDRRQADAETAPLDPIVLTVALWLGLMVTVAGFGRLSEAAANVRLVADAQGPHAVSMARPLPMAYAGY